MGWRAEFQQELDDDERGDQARLRAEAAPPEQHAACSAGRDEPA